MSALTPAGDDNCRDLPSERSAGAEGGEPAAPSVARLRQLAASAMIAQGMGDDVTSVLGHADTAITRTIYAHEFEKSRARQAYPGGDGEGLRGLLRSGYRRTVNASGALRRPRPSRTRSFAE
jgi:hypothetical protein